MTVRLVVVETMDGRYRIVFTPYFSNLSSEVTTERSFSNAVAMMNRSVSYNETGETYSTLAVSIASRIFDVNSSELNPSQISAQVSSKTGLMR